MDSLDRDSLWEHYDAKYTLAHKEPSKKTWCEVFLGEDALQCEGGEAFTVRYMLKSHVPCLLFTSTRTTGSPGSAVSLTSCLANEVLAGQMFIPLRITLDLLRLLLTHNVKRYTDAYHSNWSDAYVPVVKNNKCPPYTSLYYDKLGCSHMVTISVPGGAQSQYEDKPRGSATYLAEDSDASMLELPVLDEQHMRLRGIRNIRCGIVRHPCGNIFLTTSGWDMMTHQGRKTMMGAQGDRATQYAFPLCHSEHLPGLVAVLDRWLLTGDYRQCGLKITTVLPHDVSSMQTPEVNYKDIMDYWTDQWRSVYCVDDARKAMWYTLYDDVELSVESVYGAYRRKISLCC